MNSQQDDRYYYRIYIKHLVGGTPHFLSVGRPPIRIIYPPTKTDPGWSVGLPIAYDPNAPRNYDPDYFTPLDPNQESMIVRFDKKGEFFELALLTDDEGNVTQENLGQTLKEFDKIGLSNIHPSDLDELKNYDAFGLNLLPIFRNNWRLSAPHFDPLIERKWLGLALVGGGILQVSSKNTKKWIGLAMAGVGSWVLFDEGAI